jgi:hypothetical protein
VDILSVFCEVRTIKYLPLHGLSLFSPTWSSSTKSPCLSPLFTLLLCVCVCVCVCVCSKHEWFNLSTKVKLHRVLFLRLPNFHKINNSSLRYELLRGLLDTTLCNLVARHKVTFSLCKSWGVTASILNLSISWNWVVTAMSQPLCSPGKVPPPHSLTVGFGGPRGGLDALKKKIYAPARKNGFWRPCCLRYPVDAGSSLLHIISNLII